MAQKIRIELNHDGFKQLLTSPAVSSLIDSKAQDLAARCGEGYEASGFVGGYGGGRYIGKVRTATLEAMRDEAENKTLERAVHGG